MSTSSELLQRETFVSFDEDEAEHEVFRIPAFITADQERVFLRGGC
jgi:hypothetical protein